MPFPSPLPQHTNQWVQVVPPLYSWTSGQTLEHGCASPSLSNHQLSIAPQLRAEASQEPLSWAIVGHDIQLIATDNSAVSPPGEGRGCVTVRDSWASLFSMLESWLPLPIFPLPLLRRTLSPERHTCDTDVPFVTKHSTFTYSLHWPVVSFCLNHCSQVWWELCLMGSGRCNPRSHWCISVFWGLNASPQTCRESTLLIKLLSQAWNPLLAPTIGKQIFRRLTESDGKETEEPTSTAVSRAEN